MVYKVPDGEIGIMKNGPYEMIVAPEGYPGKRYRNRYTYEHIVVFWQNNKRLPRFGYEIHHKDGNHRNNEISNLQEVTSTEHQNIHGAIKRVPLYKYNCYNCGKIHEMSARNYRYKQKKGQKFFFCSQKCQAIKQHELGGKLR